MNRLTKVESSSVLIKDGWKKKDTESYTNVCYGCEEIGKCVNKCGFYKALEKLTEYEDTGLEPEEIKEHEEMFKAYRHVCGGRPPEEIKKALELLDLEEQGLLIKLPCKVGDTVYHIFTGKIIEDRVTRITLNKDINEIDLRLYGYIALNSIGKTVFLTREEAEKALKERGDYY